MIFSIIGGASALLGVIAGYALCEVSRKIHKTRKERKRREWLRETKAERTAELFREIGGEEA